MRHQASNRGIHVGQPKVFDDRSLQLMLAAAEQRLATLQTIDQARTMANIGTIQGGSQSETGFAAQIASLPTAGVVSSTGANNSTTGGLSQTVSNGTTGGTTLTTVAGNNPTTTNVNTMGTTGSNSSTANNSNTGGTTSSTQTTMPSVAPTLVAAPAMSGLSLPTNVSVSASDVLNEEMQLTFEIANLRLLLQGSLNDRFVTGNQRIKQHATVGFPISIATPEDRRYKNAVAEILITVTTWPDFYDKEKNLHFYNQYAGNYSQSAAAPARSLCAAYAGRAVTASDAAYSERACPEAPGLMAILPREKTYNVVDIRAKNTSVSGAATAKVLTAGVTWYHATKHYYVVQAQDTVAFEDEPKLSAATEQLNPVSTTFGWQFRPVLNECKVRPGLRQLFAELSFPTPPDGQFYGTVTVEARWRHFDEKHGAIGDPIIDTAHERKEVGRVRSKTSTWKQGNDAVPSIEWIGAWELPNFDLQPKIPQRITWDEVGGVISVAAKGFYTPGTVVVVGSTVYGPGSPGYYYDPEKIRFVAPASDLVRAGAVFLEEQGGKQRALDRDPDKLAPFDRLTITEATAVPYSNTDMILSVCYTGSAGAADEITEGMARPVALVGGKVYGLSDQPYTVSPQNPCKDKTNQFVSLRAPADAIRAARQVKLKQLFFGAPGTSQHTINIVNDFSAAKVVSVAAANSCTLLAVQGSELLLEPQPMDGPTHVLIANLEIKPRDKTKQQCSFVPATEKPATAKTPTAKKGSEQAKDNKDASKKTPLTSAAVPCPADNAYLDTSLGLATLLIAAPDCLLKAAKQMEIYRGDKQFPATVQTVLLPIPSSEEKGVSAQIDTQEVQSGTKTIHLKGAHLELVDLGTLYFTGFIGTSLGAKFSADLSYIEISLPDTLTNNTGNYALNFMQSDKTLGGALVRIIKPKSQ